MTSEAPPSQGLIAGKYKLVRMIGRGGMGSVWEARHFSLGTPSAIKFIEAEYADSEEARSRFDKEAKAAATIQSKHAIQIYDHGVTDDGKPYIVMELLQGEPLDKRIERLHRMALQDTARILQQVCRGLARAHERGIVHRDLKPENIFIVRNQDDDEEVAKVLDFGIAKMSGGAGNSAPTSSTKTGAVLGTPFYMSPEQARGLRNVDHRTDIWSLGVIAFKCLTGDLPFDGESVGDLLVKICTAPVPVPSHRAPELPPNFDAWFMRAMERDPERRFSSVTELSDALCFVAGLAPRSAGAPASSLGSGGPGVLPPFASQPHVQPHGTTPRGYAVPGPMHPALASAPGALTNSPLTSERIAPHASGRGKVVLGSVIAGVFLIASMVGGALVVKRFSDDSSKAEQSTSAPSGPPEENDNVAPNVAPSAETAGAVASAVPSATVATAAPAQEEPTPSDKTPPATNEPKATPKSAATASDGVVPPAVSNGAAAPAKSVATKGTKAPTTATSAPALPPPPTATTTVKRNRNDPGY